VCMCMCVCCNDASRRDDEIYGFLSWKGRVCELKRKCVCVHVYVCLLQ